MIEKEKITFKGHIAKQLEPPLYVISVPEWQHLTNKMKLIPCIKAANFFPGLGLMLLGIAITTFISALTPSENQIILWALCTLTSVLGLILLFRPKKRDIQIHELEWRKADICGEIKLLEERYEKEKQNNDGIKRQEDQ